MPYSQISSKGQIVIPSELREEMNLMPGTKVAIEREGNVIILRPVTPEFIDSLMGSTKGAGKERDRIHRDDEER
jgi:AbrB family looped-hinge helix DNA binding protein